MNDKLEQLYNLYKQNGIIQSTDFNTFSTADDNQRKKLYDLGKQKGLFKTTDYNTFSSAFSPVKKKEPTVSPSPSGQKPTSSGTPAKKQSGQSEYLSPESNIGLPSPVSKVDYSAKTEAVKGEYKGYPGKEENTYRVYNNIWQRKMPNQTNWQDVLNEGSVNALNKQFNQTVKYSKSQEKYKGVVEDKKEVAKKELDVKLSSINSKLVDKEAGPVVTELKKQFPDFKFASNSVFTDEVKVIAPNDKIIIISLDNWSTDSDTREARNLRSFIRDNSNTSRNEAKSEYEKAEKQMEYFDLKPFNPTIKLGEGYGEEQIVTDLNKVVKPEGAPTDIMTADMNLKSARAKLAKQSEMAYVDVIDKVRAAAKTSGKIDDDEARADLAMLKADWKETKAAEDYFNDISVQSTEIKKQWTGLQSYVDDINTKLSTGEISKEQYDAEYVPLMKKSLEDLQVRSSELNNEYTTAQNVNKSIERSAAENLVIQESRGSIAGGVAYGFTKGLTDILRVATLGSLSKDAQEDLVRAVVGYGTTEEYMSSGERSDLTKVLFSLSTTVGQAVSGGFLGKGAAAIGGGSKAVLAVETAPFFASSYYEMRDQFDDPKFSGVSDMEKVLFSAVYGTASGILEKYGLTKAVAKTPFGKNLTNTILSTAIKGLPKDASEQAIKDAIESSIVNKIKSAGVSSLGAFVVEGATEATQKTTEFLLQESFDILHKGNYFKNGTGWDMLSDVIYEGYLGGLGGTMMNIAASGARMATDGISKVLTKDQVGVLDVMTKTEGMSESFDTYLRGLVVSGDVTSEEAGVMSKGFREVKAGFDKIPSDIPLDQKTKAFDLIVERSKIEKEISGKEDNLVVAQKERINAINNELQTISKDAVQLSATEEVTEGVTTEADIETRRKEERTIKANTIEIKRTEYTDSLGNIYQIREYEDGHTEFWKKTKTSSIFENISSDKTNTYYTKEYLESLEGEPLSEAKNIDSPSGRLDKINAKYDAELAALEQSTKTDTGKQEIIPGERAVVSDIEIVYPTEEQKAERTDARSTAEFVESTSNDLPVEDIKVLSEELGGEFGLLTAENPLAQPLTDQENKSLTQKALQWLESKGYNPRRVTGKYGQGENSLFVPNLSKDDAISFAKEFNQESVAHSEGLIYQDGSMNPRVKADDDFSFSEFSPESDMVSVVKTPEGLKTFSVGYDFDNKVPMSKATSKTTSRPSKNEVTVDNFQELENQAVQAGDNNRIKVLRAARQVTKALTGVKVFIHNSPEEYRQALADASGDSIDTINSEESESRSGGQYVNGEIHLDGTIATVRTVYHEAFHDAILKSGLSVDMAKGLLKIISDKKIKSQLEAFISQYESSEQNEEMVSELGAIMAEAGTELSTTKLQQFKQLINKLAQKLGLPVILPASADRQQVVDFINSMSKSIRGGKVITQGVITNIKPNTRKSRKVSVREGYKLSFVKESDIIDINSLIDDIVSKDQKIWFWVADQLGRGYYSDAVTGNEHYLDAGPSFALDPENRSENIIWASGMAEKTLERNTSEADYIFIISGSPTASKLFNKKVFELFSSRVGDFDKFKSGILESSKLKDVNRFFDSFNSWEEIINGSFTPSGKDAKAIPARKWLLIEANKIKDKNTDLKQFMDASNAFLDIDSLRDDFYRDNDFNINDIMLVLKPTGLGGKSNHSTYERNIIGEVVGVPDRIVNAENVMPDEIYERTIKTTNTSVKTSLIAPMGSSRPREIVSNRKKRMTEPVAGNKLFNEPLKDASKIANDYAKKSGIDFTDPERVTKLDEENSKAIAAEYDKMKDNPTDPEVKKAYDAMISETISQYEEIVGSGYVVEINNEEPYSSSGDMISDLKDNKRMKIFSTESGFGDEPITDKQREDNPLLKKTKFKDANGVPLLANDLFRFVHDFFGHAKFGNGFGPVGEENAWMIHSAMYSEPARRAMTSETRGQNSWVNFSGANDKVFKLRDKARELRKQGKIDEANDLVGKVYEDMKFADQKVGLMPEWVSETGAYSRKKQKAGGKKVTAQKVNQSFKNPVKKVIVNDRTALKNQLRLETKAARESQMDLKQKQRALIVAINQMKRGGFITVNQASILAKRLAFVNVDNPIMVERFLGYAEKLFGDAEYSAKLNSAFELQKKIKKAIQSSKLQASVVATAKVFSKLNPSLVEDIDAYIENAGKVMNAVKSSRANVKDGVDIDNILKGKKADIAIELKTAMDFNEIGEYTDKAIEFENEYRKNELMSIYNDLADAKIITKEMSIEDMKEVITSVMNESKDKMPAEEKLAYIMSWLGSTANVYRPIIKSMLNGRDPFTGEDVVLSEKQEKIMRDFLKIDVTKMDVREAMFVVEAMDNFITNKITDGLETVIEKYNGNLEAKKLADSGVKTRSMNTFGTEKSKLGTGRLWAQEMMSLKTLTDLVFRGVNNAQKITKAMGLSAYENGVALANKLWNNSIDSYYNEFKKTKPNGEKFMSAKNIYERGMYAALKRTVTGNQQVQDAELKRKIKLINDSISTLMKGSERDQEIGKMYSEVAEKLGINEAGVTMLDIESRVDLNNMKAVDWWVSKWADNYSELADVSQNVYNTILDRDMYYTPDKFSSTKPVEKSVEEVFESGGAFGQFLDYEYDKKSGVLMTSAKQSSMAEGRFLDLNFDMNNSKSLKAALVDMKTATSIRKISGFLKSKDWEKVMTSKEDRDVFRKKIDNYILRSRNKSTGAIDNDYAQALDKAGKIWASMGAARALGGFTQPLKQTIPVLMSTIINSGRFDLATGKDQNDWISKIGRGISNRGLESQAGFEYANRMVDDAVNSGNAVKVLAAIERSNRAILRTVLAKPDVFIARSSFISYYKQYMANNGMSEDINYSKPEDANQDALDYAQRMIDRQQNVSDGDLAGELMASNNPYKKLTRNILLPFASFSINQKSRMFTDFATLMGKEVSSQDKSLAIRSLIGLAAEIAVFNAIAFGIKAAIIEISEGIVPPAPEDEKEKEEQLWKQWGYIIGNVIANVISPVPLTDSSVISSSDWIYKKVNKIAKSSSSETKEALKKHNEERELKGQRALEGKEADRWMENYEEEDRFKIRAYTNENMAGTYTITYNKLVDLKKSYDLAFNGEYDQDMYGKVQKKYILKEDRDILKYMWYGNAITNIVGFPSEYSSVSRRVENNVKKKSAISEKKFDTYNDVVSHKGGDLNKAELFLVKNMDGNKSQSGTERVIEEIEWIKKKGGFDNERQMDKYIEIYQKEKSVNSSDMEEIQKIK